MRVRGALPGMWGVLTGKMGVRALWRGAGEEVPGGCYEIKWLIVVAMVGRRRAISRPFNVCSLMSSGRSGNKDGVTSFDAFPSKPARQI